MKATACPLVSTSFPKDFHWNLQNVHFTSLSFLSQPAGRDVSLKRERKQKEKGPMLRDRLQHTGDEDKADLILDGVQVGACNGPSIERFPGTVGSLLSLITSSPAQLGSIINRVWAVPQPTVALRAKQPFPAGILTMPHEDTGPMRASGLLTPLSRESLSVPCGCFPSSPSSPSFKKVV